MAKITGYSYVPKNYQDPIIHQNIQIYVPMLPIRISKDHGQISPLFDALADSGSDRNLFPMALANYLGIDFKKIKPNKIYGIGKDHIEAFPAEINIWLGTKKFEADADSSPQQNIPILGRNGFFNLFKSIKFDEKGQFVYIEE